MIRLRFIIAIFVLPVLYAQVGTAQDAGDFFQRSCASCHTVGGGRLTGPDLKDVSKRKERAWLERFVQNPKAVLDSGDAYAAQLLQDARGVVMPAIPGVTPPVAKALVDMIEAESQLPKSRFAGTSISERPFTPADLATGMALYRGTQRLAGGGPACISCHRLGTLQSLGGGNLGPDLTLVYERLGGRKAAGVWLSAPATPTMQALFDKSPLQSEEILPLLAVFEDAAKKPPATTAGNAAQINFFLLGFGGAGLVLLVMARVWCSRFRSVRRDLVTQARGAE